MPAYIDLNPVRAGLVSDPKDYRFCGYAEAVASRLLATKGLRAIWGAYADGSLRGRISIADALQMHRALIFGKRASDTGLSESEYRTALQILEKEDARLPKSTVLRCRVRYFRQSGFCTQFCRCLANGSRSKVSAEGELLAWHGLAGLSLYSRVVTLRI